MVADSSDIGADNRGGECGGGANGPEYAVVGRLTQPTSIVVRKALGVCPVEKSVLLETDLSLALVAGTPLLVEAAAIDEYAIRCSTIPYHSAFWRFCVPMDRVVVHRRVLFDMKQGAFMVLGAGSQFTIIRQFDSLVEAENYLGEEDAIANDY